MKKLQILGTGCKKCLLLTEHVEAATEQLGLVCEIEKVTDLNTIIDMGVMVTPALVIDGKVVMSGKTSSPEEIKAILQNLG
ncbi:MAG: thioredoxin family protein [bacterium]|nr:thioredoxin family protein [bacterium]